MTVKNPITLIYRIPTNNVRKYNKAGLSFGSIISEANGYAYVAATTAYNNRYDIHNGYQWGATANYNLKLGPDTPVGPEMPSLAHDGQKVKLILLTIYGKQLIYRWNLFQRGSVTARNYIQRAQVTRNLSNPTRETERQGRYRGQLLKVAMEAWHIL